MSDSVPFVPSAGNAEPVFATDPIRFAGPDSTDPLAFRYYEPDRIVAGRRMRDHLRFAVCWWHGFAWPGADMFGAGAFDRPWFHGDPRTAARARADAAFEFFAKLGVDFYTFHDRDIAPEAGTFAESQAEFARMVDVLERKQAETGIRLLWGTANLFHHPRYAAGAATNPDPDIFAVAAAQVADALEATHRLGGANYVLWGGREGYDTLLNTDLKRERAQLARFLALVAEHKARIGFTGPLLIEPKPHEPTKHQYDRDVASIHGFLVEHRLEGQFKLNVEANHATLAGHDFHHEVETAIACGLLGSIDANRGDPRLGWDTDQFPNDIAESALILAAILDAGGLGAGGFNFDAKLRRQSVDPADLFHAHVGAMDTVARGLLVADAMRRDGTLAALRARRYAGWDGAEGRAILDGQRDLAALRARVRETGLDPRAVSGRQEMLENLVNRFI